MVLAELWVCSISVLEFRVSSTWVPGGVLERFDFGVLRAILCGLSACGGRLADTVLVMRSVGVGRFVSGQGGVPRGILKVSWSFWISVVKVQVTRCKRM